MKEITVTIKMSQEIDESEADDLISYLDAEMAWVLNKDKEQFEAKTGGCGWGIGKSLVTSVTRNEE